MILKIKFIIIGMLCLANLDILAQEEKNNIATSLFKVEGVCNMCKERIENAATIKGVKFAEWDKNTDTLKVIYRTDKTTIEDIHKSIASAGHKTDLMDADEKAYNNLPDCCAYLDDAKKH